MPRKTRSQNQLASSLTSQPTSSSEIPRRPRKEKATELAEVETAQISNCQAQFKETAGVMSQEIDTIKQLLERLLILWVLVTTRGDTTVEERCIEQQAAKTTTRGKAASGRRTNSRRLNLPIQPYQTIKRRTLRLDYPNLIMQRCQASHRGS